MQPHGNSSYRLFWKMFPRPIPPRPRPLAATTKNTETHYNMSNQRAEVTHIFTGPKSRPIPTIISHGVLFLGHLALNFSTWMQSWSSEPGDIVRPCQNSNWSFTASHGEMRKCHAYIIAKFSVFISQIEMHLNDLWRESGILSPGGGYLRGNKGQNSSRHQCCNNNSSHNFD